MSSPAPTSPSTLPPIFPFLPRVSHHTWSANIQTAHQVLADVYHRALPTTQQDSDPLRVAFHIDAIISNAIPILSAMEEESEAEDSPDESRLPREWLQASAMLFGNLVVALQGIKELNIDREDAEVITPDPVTVIRTGKPGRPRKVIDLDFLREASSAQRQLRLTELAYLLGMHRNTLRLYMKKHDVLPQYSKISNYDLDILVRTFKARRPESGIRYLVGFLRSHGLRIQRRRVALSMKRTDRLGQVLRERKVIQRKQYHVKRPNALWHLDGHHKLIRWGIVIHGFIDGYSRTVTALKASTNNRAITVLELFLDTLDEYGMPSRMRGD